MVEKTVHIIALIAFIVFICEYGIYYIVLSQCSYGTGSPDITALRVMLIADTHLIGYRKGHWFDKLRREWQMRRAFQTALVLHQPEIIFLLGDAFDEGSFSPDDVHGVYVNQFFDIFRTNNETELYVIPGNHDIGFHYVMSKIPYLERRFKSTFNVSSVQLLSRKDIHFILINSIAMEGDSCDICTKARRRIQNIADRLECTRDDIKCKGKTRKLSSLSKPIILQHFPMYREDDSKCDDVDSAPQSEKEIPFKEKWDCLSKKSTDFLFDKLQPRLVFSGHTHHACKSIHGLGIEEYTVPAFNWRNKNEPSFLLALLKRDSYDIGKCKMPTEYTIACIYVIGVSFTILYALLMRKRTTHIKLH